MRHLMILPVLALATATRVSAQPSAPPSREPEPLTRADAAAPRTAEERAVWALIEQGAAGRPPVTDDAVFVSGAYPRPVRVGGASWERSGRQSPDSTIRAAQRVVDQRRNATAKIVPLRVTVSASGDMAYGIAFTDLAYDRPDSTGRLARVQFEATQLTVWRKVDGQWRLAASFARPNS